LLYKDEAGKRDKSNPLAPDKVDKNLGLTKIQASGAGSREIDMIGRLDTDVIISG
jgi:hypothetical protein